jgi:hypothetical protein
MNISLGTCLSIKTFQDRDALGIVTSLPSTEDDARLGVRWLYKATQIDPDARSRLRPYPVASDIFLCALPEESIELSSIQSVVTVEPYLLFVTGVTHYRLVGYYHPERKQVKDILVPVTSAEIKRWYKHNMAVTPNALILNAEAKLKVLIPEAFTTRFSKGIAKGGEVDLKPVLIPCAGSLILGLPEAFLMKAFIGKVLLMFRVSTVAEFKLLTGLSTTQLPWK